MNLIGKETSAKREFPVKELEKLPTSSLQFHTDLRDVLQSKKGVQLYQKKKLLLTLHVILFLSYDCRVCWIQWLIVNRLLRKI